MARERTPAELGEDLDELKESLASLHRKLDALPFVRKDVYDAQHTALRTEIALEMANLTRGVDHVRGVALSSRQLSMWALGLICTAVVAGIVSFLINAGGP